jgi:DNA-binding MarR family transcriptional regulator
MRDKQDRVLTDRQARVVRAMSHTWETASDIAHRAEVDNRGVGAVLRGLEQRGVVESKKGAFLNDREWYRHPKTWRLV